MLAVSALRNTNECQGEMESFLMQDFSSSDGNLLLECIDFDDLFVGINDSDDMLPDLDQMEYTSVIFAEFSAGEESSSVVTGEDQNYKADDFEKEDLDDDNVNNSSKGLGEEIASNNKRDFDESVPAAKIKGRKSSSIQQKSSNNVNSQGKRKLKVDWTPELHRRFVQAVEQLGVDKAVPSRILELMGIDCLTRHNIASHLQKYRSHRKHLQTREAEAAKWTHKRQIYSSAPAVAASGGGGKRDVVSPWVAPATMGFPPPMAHHQVHPHPHPQHHFRPLHVWGHPSMDQSLVHMWPNKHSPPPTSPPAAPWVPPPHTPSSDPAYWHPHLRVQNGLTQGTPCYPQPMATMRFAAPPLPVQPPHAMYKVEPGSGVPRAQFGPYSPLDVRPSKESIDAAIGDALSKPWQPLPLGLKPPVIDTVMVELQRQGIPKIPPT